MHVPEIQPKRHDSGTILGAPYSPVMCGAQRFNGTPSILYISTVKLEVLSLPHHLECLFLLACIDVCWLPTNDDEIQN